MTDREVEACAGFYLTALCMLFAGIWLEWNLGLAFVIVGALVLWSVFIACVADYIGDA